MRKHPKYIYPSLTALGIKNFTLDACTLKAVTAKAFAVNVFNIKTLTLKAFALVASPTLSGAQLKEDSSTRTA